LPALDNLAVTLSRDAPHTEKIMARTQAAVDAVTLLKQDHRTVEELFERYERARSKDVKARLAREICMELSVHTRIEEEIFYPAIAPAVEEDVIDEAYVEHDGAKSLVAELMAADPDGDEFYDAKVKVLSEMIKHHVKEEEQRGGMFAQAKESDVDMKAMGELLAARKAELKAEYESAGIPPQLTRSMIGAELERGQRVEAR
jgi:galactokinase